MIPRLIRLLFVGIWGLLPSVALYGMIIEHLRPPAKTHARQPRPLDRALAFFDPWLCRAAFVVKGDDPLGRARQVGDDVSRRWPAGTAR